MAHSNTRLRISPLFSGENTHWKASPTSGQSLQLSFSSRLLLGRVAMFIDQLVLNAVTFF